MNAVSSPTANSIANILNLHCACVTLNPDELYGSTELEISQGRLPPQLQQSHPHLFSETAVYIDENTRTAISQIVCALDKAMNTELWRTQALALAPDVAQHEFGPTGVFMGYDFHLSDQGPKLIEINTNAGGALLNTAVLRAHLACCSNMPKLNPKSQPDQLNHEWVSMFTREWRSQRGDLPLRTLLITDDEPDLQFLSIEFELTKQLLQRNGFTVAVGDASAFKIKDGALTHPALPNQSIDLVYNRLTDFDLSQPNHAALRIAYEQDLSVITPNPRAHALYANKRHLISLSDPHFISTLALSAQEQALILQAVPRTELVRPEQAESLWARRKQLFFKPMSGFGSKAAYRGDKLTTKVWQDILDKDYVAQAIVQPSERIVRIGPTEYERHMLKVDIRAYAYQGQVQLLAARTWSGQTTNFRTEGGGFSPVFTIPEVIESSDKTINDLIRESINQTNARECQRQAESFMPPKS